MLKDFPSRLSRSSAAPANQSPVASLTRREFNAIASAGLDCAAGEIGALESMIPTHRTLPAAQVEHEMCSEYSHAAPRLSKQQLARTRRWPGLGPEYK